MANATILQQKLLLLQDTFEHFRVAADIILTATHSTHSKCGVKSFKEHVRPILERAWEMEQLGTTGNMGGGRTRNIV